jgi:putative ABC transport system substrate-binding protein
LAEDVSTKLVELLQATIPNVASIGIVLNPANPSNPSMLKRIEALIGPRTVRLRPIEIRLRNELDNAFAALRGERLDALLVLPDFMLIDAREAVIAHSLRLRMPAITNVPEYTDAGALVSYGASRRFNYRRSAYYVKRILDGVKPADLPIEQPAQIELSVNLKTANKLGISIPKAMLTRADRVID